MTGLRILRSHLHPSQWYGAPVFQEASKVGLHLHSFPALQTVTPSESFASPPLSAMAGFHYLIAGLKSHHCAFCLLVLFGHFKRVKDDPYYRGCQ